MCATSQSGGRELPTKVATEHAPLNGLEPRWKGESDRSHRELQRIAFDHAVAAECVLDDGLLISELVDSLSVVDDPSGFVLDAAAPRDEV